MYCHLMERKTEKIFIKTKKFRNVILSYLFGVFANVIVLSNISSPTFTFEDRAFVADGMCQECQRNRNLRFPVMCYHQ